jgi:hypothetical protein
MVGFLLLVFCGVFFTRRNGGRKIIGPQPWLSAQALEAGAKI